MKSPKYIYTVYERQTETVVAIGTAQEIASALNMAENTLRCAMAKGSKKYTFAKEPYAELPPEPDPDPDERMTSTQEDRFVRRWNNMRARYIGHIHIANPCDKCQLKEHCADVGLTCPAWERYFKLEWDYRLMGARKELGIHMNNKGESGNA